MKMRVQRDDGEFETIELPQDAWQVLRLGSINTSREHGANALLRRRRLLSPHPAGGRRGGAGGSPEPGIGGLEPTFA